MTLDFDVIDKIIHKLPKDVNKVIYDYYDNRCKKCGGEMKMCDFCNDYFHIYHSCYRHKTDDCEICKEGSCPYNQLSNKYCLCEDINKCQNCFYTDITEEETELNGITEYTGLLEREHTDLYEELFRQGWLDIQTKLIQQDIDELNN